MINIIPEDIKFFEINWIVFNWNKTIEEVEKELRFIYKDTNEYLGCSDESESDIIRRAIEEDRIDDEMEIESVITTMDNYRKRTHWDFKNAEIFWKYYNNELRDLLQKTYL